MSDKKLEVLPDSRSKSGRGAVNRGKQGIWLPVYCANCGVDGGMVPEENMTFAFYLCDPCFEKWGHIAGTYAQPDAAFWAEVEQAQIEKYGRKLTLEELTHVVATEETSLVKLIRQGPSKP